MNTRVALFCVAVTLVATLSFSGVTFAQGEGGAKVDDQGAPKSDKSLSDVGSGGWKEWRKKNEAKIAKINYKNHCSACHGEKGDGKGQAADELTVPPRDHTNTAYMKTRTNKQLLNVVMNGGSAEGFDIAMPPHNTVMTKKDAQDLVKYLRVLCKCDYEKQ